MKIVNNCKLDKGETLTRLYTICKQYADDSKISNSCISNRLAILTYCKYRILGGKRHAPFLEYVNGISEMCKYSEFVCNLIKQSNIKTIEGAQRAYAESLSRFLTHNGIDNKVGRPTVLVNHLASVHYEINNRSSAWDKEIRYYIGLKDNKYNISELCMAIIRIINEQVGGSFGDTQFFFENMTNIKCNFWSRIEFIKD